MCWVDWQTIFWMKIYLQQIGWYFLQQSPRSTLFFCTVATSWLTQKGLEQIFILPYDLRTLPNLFSILYLRLQYRWFPVNFAFFKNIVFLRTPPVAAFAGNIAKEATDETIFNTITNIKHKNHEKDDIHSLNLQTF